MSYTILIRHLIRHLAPPGLPYLIAGATGLIRQDKLFFRSRRGPTSAFAVMRRARIYFHSADSASI